MTNDANMVIQALRKLSSGREFPTSVRPKDIQDITGLSTSRLNIALSDIVDNGYQIVLTEGNNTYVNVSISKGFE